MWDTENHFLKGHQDADRRIRNSTAMAMDIACSDLIYVLSRPFIVFSDYVAGRREYFVASYHDDHADSITNPEEQFDLDHLLTAVYKHGPFFAWIGLDTLLIKNSVLDILALESVEISLASSRQLLAILHRALVADYGNAVHNMQYSVVELGRRRDLPYDLVTLIESFIPREILNDMRECLCCADHVSETEEEFISEDNAEDFSEAFWEMVA